MAVVSITQLSEILSFFACPWQKKHLNALTIKKAMVLLLCIMVIDMARVNLATQFAIPLETAFATAGVYAIMIMISGAYAGVLAIITRICENEGSIKSFFAYSIASFAGMMFLQFIVSSLGDLISPTTFLIVVLLYANYALISVIHRIFDTSIVRSAFYAMVMSISLSVLLASVILLVV